MSEEQEWGEVFFFVKQPEPSEWQVELLPHVTFRPRKGDEPNAFHRFMQRLAFGVRWVKAP